MKGTALFKEPTLIFHVIKPQWVSCLVAEWTAPHNQSAGKDKSPHEIVQPCGKNKDEEIVSLFWQTFIGPAQLLGPIFRIFNTFSICLTGFIQFYFDACEHSINKRTYLKNKQTNQKRQKKLSMSFE